MFFILSKLLAFITAPAIWLLGIMLWAVFTKNPQRRKKLARASLLFFFIFSNGVLQNEVRRAFEPATKTPDDLQENYDIGIVLSGMVYFDRDHNQAHFTETSDRIKQAMDLYALGKINRIMVSGGSGSLSQQDMKEADYMKNFLMNMGIPESRILIERESRNTFENAKNTAEILDAMPYGNLLLITSATHMPRAQACFKKAGLVFETYPANPVYSRDSYGLKTWLLPNPRVMGSWQSLFHEWVGLAAYRVKGYI